MILKIDKLTKSFGKNSVFRQANLEIKTPGIYGLVAPNGFGKTTLLNIVSGIERYQEGTIEVLGSDVKNTKGKDLAFLQSNEVLYNYLSGYDHLKFLCDIHQLPATDIHQVASLFEMEEYLKKKVGKYSLGMKQRLLLAMAIIKQPKFILLDEPLTGLDPSSTLIVRENLVRLAQEGITMLISSHDLNELDKLTTDIFFIQEQKLVFENRIISAKEFLHLEIKLEDEKKLQAFLATAEITDYHQTDSHFILENITEEPSQLIKKMMLADIDVLTFHVESTSSESLYKDKYMTKGQ